MGGMPELGILGRVRSVLGTLDLDCGCRAKLDDALRRFEALEHRRGRRDLISDARAQCERVAALLDLLKELDEVRVDEADHGVFEELALLFETMAAAATRGAEDMRRFRALLETENGPRAAPAGAPVAIFPA